MSKYNILSFDIGTRNLSFQYAETTNELFNIVLWENIDLTKYNISSTGEGVCDAIILSGKNEGKPCSCTTNLLPYVCSYEEYLIPPDTILDMMLKKDLIVTCSRLLKNTASTEKVSFEKMTVAQLRARLQESARDIPNCVFKICKEREPELCQVFRCNSSELEYNFITKNYCLRHYPTNNLYKDYFRKLCNKQAEVKKINRMTLAENLWKALDTYPQILQSHCIDIEKQMRKDMIMIVAWIQMYLSMRGYKGQLSVISAEERFKVYDGPEIVVPDTKTYKSAHPRNKYVAIQQCKYLLEKLGLTSELNKLNASKKADDLADTFLMAANRYCKHFPKNTCDLKLSSTSRCYTRGKSRPFRSPFTRYNKKKK